MIELQRASVEEVRSKDKPFCLRLIVDDGKSEVLYMALNNDEEYSRWLKRLRKVLNFMIFLAFQRKCFFRQRTNYQILLIIPRVI